MSMQDKTVVATDMYHLPTHLLQYLHSDDTRDGGL